MYQPPTISVRYLDKTLHPNYIIVVVDVDPKTGHYIEVHGKDNEPLANLYGHVWSGWGGYFESGYFSHLQRVWRKRYHRKISLRTIRQQVENFKEQS